MNFFFVVASFLIGTAHAYQPCVIGSAHVLRAVQDLQVEARSFEGGVLRMKMRGTPDCANNLEVGVEFNQDEANAVLERPARGAVLFATVRNKGTEFEARINATPELVGKLEQEWQSKRNLNRFINGVSLTWSAYYSAEATVRDPAELARLGAECARGITTKMQCPAVLDWQITTVPRCMEDIENRLRLARSIEFEDSVVRGRNPRAKVSGYGQNICPRGQAPRIEFAKAAASALIFNPEWRDRKEVTELGIIEIKGQIKW